MQQITVLDQKVEFSTSQVFYFQLESQYRYLAKQAADSYIRDIHTKYPTIDSLIREGFNDGLHSIKSFLETASVKLIELGDYSSTAEKLYNQYSPILSQWEDIFLEIKQEYRSILEKREEEILYREQRKESRTKYQGFGWSGIIQAGIVNMATGLAHSAVNSIQNSSIPQEEHTLYEHIIKSNILHETLYETIVSISHALVITLIERGFLDSASFICDEDKQTAKDILQNIAKGNIPQGKHSALALVHAVKLDPLNEDIYEFLYKRSDYKTNGLYDLSELTGYRLHKKHKFTQDPVNQNTLEASKVEQFNSNALVIGQDLAKANLQLGEFHADLIRNEQIKKTLLVPEITDNSESNSIVEYAQEKVSILEKEQNKSQNNVVLEKQNIWNEIRVNFLSNPESSFYLGTDIPVKKSNNFIRNVDKKLNHQLLLSDILFYFDETVFGSGDNGVAVTKEFLIMIEPLTITNIIPIEIIKEVSVKGTFNRTITLDTTLGSLKLTLTQGNKGSEELVKAIVFMVNRCRAEQV